MIDLAATIGHILAYTALVCFCASAAILIVILVLMLIGACRDSTDDARDARK